MIHNILQLLIPYPHKSPQNVVDNRDGKRDGIFLQLLVTSFAYLLQWPTQLSLKILAPSVLCYLIICSIIIILLYKRGSSWLC